MISIHFKLAATANQLTYTDIGLKFDVGVLKLRPILFQCNNFNVILSGFSLKLRHERWRAMCILSNKDSGLQERRILAQKLFFSSCPTHLHETPGCQIVVPQSPTSCIQCQGFLSARCRRRRQDINSGANPRLAQKRALHSTSHHWVMMKLHEILSIERDSILTI